jgi:hypothetical protein
LAKRDRSVTTRVASALSCVPARQARRFEEFRRIEHRRLSMNSNQALIRSLIADTVDQVSFFQ